MVLMGKPAPEKEIKLSRQNQPKIPRPSPNAEFVQRLNDGSTGSNQKNRPILKNAVSVQTGTAFLLYHLKRQQKRIDNHQYQFYSTRFRPLR